MENIHFNRNLDAEFWQTLKTRINQVFQSEKISIHASKLMYIKLFFWILMFIIPYLLLVFTTWALIFKWFLCVMMGISMAGIGFNISHQAAHGAISSKKWINRAFSLSFNLVGMSDYIWRIKHNVFHHAYTNIYEADEALKEGEVLRLSADATWKPIHQFQHFYTAFVYAFFTIFWAFFLDIEKLIRYNGNGNLEKKAHPTGEVILFWATKIYYVFIMFIVPYFYLKYSLSVICIGFLTIHIIGSSLITHVLQVEHLNEEAIIPTLGDDRKIEKSWAANQLEGTANFKTTSRWFEWFIGGCNYQIEHHLFPHICSEHYPKISKIVEQTATEFGLKYHSFSSFSSAIDSHYRLLKILGQKNTPCQN